MEGSSKCRFPHLVLNCEGTVLNRLQGPSNSTSRRRMWRYGPLVLWILFISFASTGEFSAQNTSSIIRPLLLWFFPKLTEAQFVFINLLTRKVAHFTEYAVLAFLARRALISSSKPTLRRYWFQISLALVVVYSLVDELHQRFVPSRTGSIYDSLIDIAGGLTILLIYKLWRKQVRVVASSSEFSR